MLAFVVHHLGDLLEVEFAKPASFVNSFLPHVFGVPKWFFQITAPPKPATVHYSGVIVPWRHAAVDRQFWLYAEPNLQGAIDNALTKAGFAVVFGGGDAEVDVGSTGTMHATTLVIPVN